LAAFEPILSLAITLKCSFGSGAFACQPAKAPLLGFCSGSMDAVLDASMGRMPRQREPYGES